MATSNTRSQGHRTAPDGFIVVVVLWILGGLSVLVSIYSVYVIETATGFAIQDDRLRATELTSTAIELGAYQQLALPPQSRATRGAFNFRLGQANVSVAFRSEASRIDLNAAPKPLLAGLFVALGARPDAADTYADRVVGWRTPASAGNDREAFFYQGAPYGPRGAKFPHVNELQLIRGLPADLIERALPLVTVHSGRPQVNIFDAEPEVVAALPGMSRERLQAVLAQRLNPRADPKDVLALLGPAQQFATTEGSKAMRYAVKMAFDNGFHARSEVVILLFEDGNEPFAVLSRRDDVDEPGTQVSLMTGVR